MLPTCSQIIEALYHSADFNAALRCVEAEGLQDDLKQEVLLTLLELPDNRLQTLHAAGSLQWYSVRLIFNMASGKNPGTAFSKNYLRKMEQLPDKQLSGTPAEMDTASYHDRLSRIEHSLQCLTDYERELLRIYADHNCNASEVARLTTINCRSVQHAIKIAKDKCKLFIQSSCTSTPPCP